MRALHNDPIAATKVAVTRLTGVLNQTDGAVVLDTREGEPVRVSSQDDVTSTIAVPLIAWAGSNRHVGFISIQVEAPPRSYVVFQNGSYVRAVEILDRRTVDDALAQPEIVPAISGAGRAGGDKVLVITPAGELSLRSNR
jgi:hypothetical protein